MEIWRKKMPKNKGSRVVEVRNKWRKVNYERGRFGSRRKLSVHRYSKEMMRMIMKKVVCDRELAKWFGSSVNGIQIKRWRIKNGY